MNENRDRLTFHVYFNSSRNQYFLFDVANGRSRQILSHTDKLTSMKAEPPAIYGPGCGGGGDGGVLQTNMHVLQILCIVESYTLYSRLNLLLCKAVKGSLIDGAVVESYVDCR